MQNNQRTCFTMLDASINKAFKASKNPTIIGWHTGMRVQEILDQLSTIYCQPTPVAMELNNVVFCSQYFAADAPKSSSVALKNASRLQFWDRITYTDCQLINNAIRLLLTTGLYQRPFEEWDRLLPAFQTWITLQALIQEAFQWRFNATTPTAGHHRYAPPHLYQQNVFGILGMADDDNEANTVTTQVAALTYQSHLMQSTAVNTSQHQEHQMAQLSAVQDATHATLHQLIDGMNALAFNVSDTGHGCYIGCGYGGSG
jgi:hypothetical protein